MDADLPVPAPSLTAINQPTGGKPTPVEPLLLWKKQVFILSKKEFPFPIHRIQPTSPSEK